MEADLIRPHEFYSRTMAGKGEILTTHNPFWGSEIHTGMVDGNSMCAELWHACAGPLVPLPRKGSMVVYFPQGHMEHLAASVGRGAGQQMPSYRLPPQIFCNVLNVNLHADQDTDEVYAQLTLVPRFEPTEKCVEEEEDEQVQASMAWTPHMFCKILTASDTSTHGGFSVPRRAAEDCFPPLDYNQQRPSQQLVAIDLHGIEWKFRHIYRGQPRRHLLTTGWSVFVSNKKLVSGDAVVFLCGENGELRLGIRRASWQQSSFHSSTLPSQAIHLDVLTAAAHALATNSMFHIFYSPRTNPVAFVIPYHKYVKSINHPVSVGMRFKLIFETEDATKRRSTGTITGIGDADPVRWPGSKWRSIKDKDQAGVKGERNCKLFGFTLVEESACIDDVTSSKSSKGAIALDALHMTFDHGHAWSSISQKQDLPQKNSHEHGKEVALEGSEEERNFHKGVTVKTPVPASGRSHTKVHKQGNAVGRAVDLSKFDGYNELISELEHLFDMEGSLCNPDTGWQVAYTDNEGDITLVGDDPWQEFCNIVCKILICTEEDVVKMMPAVFNDDAQSSSQEWHATLEGSKCSVDCHGSYLLQTEI